MLSSAKKKYQRKVIVWINIEKRTDFLKNTAQSFPVISRLNVLFRHLISHLIWGKICCSFQFHWKELHIIVYTQVARRIFLKPHSIYMGRNFITQHFWPLNVPFSAILLASCTFFHKQNNFFHLVLIKYTHWVQI